jgi:hypothetical protein
MTTCKSEWPSTACHFRGRRAYISAIAGGNGGGRFRGRTMASSAYHVVTRWRVAGTVSKVFAILSDPTGHPRWGPDVFLETREQNPDAGLTAVR